MPHGLTAYVCQQCGSQYPQSYGRCPGCGAWGSLAETLQKAPARSRTRQLDSNAAVRSLPEILVDASPRIKVGLAEFDRVLGGGIVSGSAILVAGDPGIGKSTLLLQAASQCVAAGCRVLYASGEESPEQLRMRAHRLGIADAELHVLPEADVEGIAAAATALQPSVLVVDSIQTATSADLESPAGSIGQVRESAARLVRLAKTTGTAIFLVGHVTKEGNIAGPKVLEHMVDVVLYLEGDNVHGYRILRTMKNRYGPTHEIGVFEMRDGGLEQVANPSKLFMSDEGPLPSGAALTVTVEGTRPLVVEIQALAVKSSFGQARRSATGLDLNRLNMLAAVLSKRAGVDVSTEDLYLNVVGGMRLAEPAVDLATILAIYSSHREVELPRATLIGEVGLGGEIRPVRHLARRLEESGRLGIPRAVAPRTLAEDAKAPTTIEVEYVSTLAEAIYAVAC